MSVIIKGMEMPVGKKTTHLEIHSDGVVLMWQTGDNDKVVGKAIPLPEKHGKLIDANALKETLAYYIREAEWDEKTNQALGWVKDEFIDSEPTIVEAEE